MNKSIEMNLKKDNNSVRACVSNNTLKISLQKFSYYLRHLVACKFGNHVTGSCL